MSPQPLDREKREKPRYRPPVGLPLPRDSRTAGTIGSIAVHLLILLLLIGPWGVAHVIELKSGGGGPGPAGGGGGGNNGSGGVVQERARYIEVKPPPPPPEKKQPQLVVPPVVKPPPPPPPPPPPKPEPQKVDPAPEAPKDAAPVAGTGGGTGHDGTAGSGPGTGGGVGSGDGSGRGSARGPGTGGGEGRTYPPTVTNLAILPIPVPSKIRPYKLTATFEVDERGNTRLLDWNRTKDNDYNKKVEAMLKEVRFRPAVRWDGTPVKDTTWITAEAP